MHVGGPWDGEDPYSNKFICEWENRITATGGPSPRLVHPLDTTWLLGPTTPKQVLFFLAKGTQLPVNTRVARPARVTIVSVPLYVCGMPFCATTAPFKQAERTAVSLSLSSDRTNCCEQSWKYPGPDWYYRQHAAEAGRASESWLSRQQRSGAQAPPAAQQTAGTCRAAAT